MDPFIKDLFENSIVLKTAYCNWPDEVPIKPGEMIEHQAVEYILDSISDKGEYEAPNGETYTHMITFHKD